MSDWNSVLHDQGYEMLGLLDNQDWGIVTVIIVLAVGWSAHARQVSAALARLRQLERKVDAIVRQLGVSLTEPGDELSAEVRELAISGGKIAAIKRHRELTGCGLKEAKDAVEAYLDR